ncbi:MAG: transcriptional regulator [Methylomonas sp.]|nr:transcriptional regulator [Methylomonas sp.]
MQLAITVLGNKTDGFIAELLSAISDCHCSILEFCTSSLTEITSAYILVDGNWNHVAKLEGLVESLGARFQIQVSLLRPPKSAVATLPEGVPYTLETISMEKKDLLFDVMSFLLDRGIVIDEIEASLHPAALFSHKIFSTRFTLLVPPDVRILSLREEFLDFCDNSNIDAILEPIKR